MTPLARIQFAEPHVSYYPAFVQRAPEGEDFYEIPEALIATYEQAKAAFTAAEDAIRRHIVDNGLSVRDGWVAAGWISEEATR